MKKLIILILNAICFFACKKEEKTFRTSSTINVINSAIGITQVKVNPSSKSLNYAMTTASVNYSASKFYYAEIGFHSLVAVASTDTTKTLFRGSFDFQPGIYTMYLGGQAPNIDTLFRKEFDFPFIKTDIAKPATADSAVNVRFVNLSPNSPALKINIKNSTSNEVDNFTYKSIGKWKAYNNKAATTTNYIFEVRNASTNELILTYTFGASATNRFKNVALIIKGLVGGTGSNVLGIFPANYF